MNPLTRVRRLVSALVFALLMVGGLLLLLNGNDGPAQAAPAAPAAPLTLPPPWLSDPDVVDAPYSAPSIWPPPAIDGYIAPGEYAHAGKVTFPGYAGEVEVFVNQDAITLYIALDSPDTTPYPYISSSGTGPAFQIFLDTDNSKDSLPQPGDYRLTLDKGGNTMENQGNGTGWGAASAGANWTAAVYTSTWGWQAEFAIAFSKLGITAGVPTSIGLALAEVWTPSWPTDWYWPAGGYYANPSTWGYLTSSSEWNTFYWKPGPWEDYAPSGMPDFDQKQDGWWGMGMTGPVSTHCGPVAAANSLWWFDSKFETPDHPPPGISDTYRLVWSYNSLMWDDHDPQNVGGMGTPGLVDDLALYFDTNGIRTGGGWLGTYVTDMHSGTLAYLRDHGLWDDYIVTLVEQPDFRWVADEVQRSEDVILLLGFWEWVDPDGMPGTGDEYWARVGGHYVNVAGVDPTWGQIAFSDPFMDNAGAGGPGRVLSGTLIPHQPIPGHTTEVHNDAGNVSHDIYAVVSTDSPGGTWGPADYPLAWEPWPFLGANPHPEIPTEDWGGEYIQVEVEYALAVSPYTWKASGEWIPEDDDPIWGYWQPWEDYAPNGVPDFDQKQDNWQSMLTPQWTFCGPAAAANSLWWFDSKFEPNPVGPPLPPYQPPIPYNDNYPLVQTYDPTGAWDDHDPLNVDDPATPWPPGGEFVEDLAMYFDTDGAQTGSLHSGTVITDLYHGIEQYITDHNLRQGYVITQVKSPDFWWVAEEVEVSEDVILLMGFWQAQPDGWVRLGGHYVTLPGIDKQGGFVAFSDPWFDRIGQTWPYAGIGALPGWPSYMGRIADGWLTPHLHPAVPPDTTHNDAGNVSHDVYNIVGTDSPGGVWGPEEYVDSWGSIENFWGQNGQEALPPVTGDPIQAEVEWAVAVSPVADVWITKRVTPTVVAPGDWITFTIAFGNDGSLPAEEVVIRDILPPELMNANWDYWTSNGLTITAQLGATYVWDLPDLAWREWGIITITAQIDPSLNSSAHVDNTAEIATSSVEQYQVAPLPNIASATFQIIVRYGVDLTPDTAHGSGDNGDTVVYTFTVQNAGNVPDSFNLSLADDDWPTTLSTNSVGPLNPGVGVSLQVSVTIPGTEVGFAFDQATVTAQSGASSTVSDTSVFTTSVIPHYAMRLDPASDSRVDNPGKTVTYTLTVYNDGNITDTYDLTKTITTWPTSLSTNSVGPLAPWSHDSLEVYVTIPLGVLNGAQDVVTVTAASQGATLLNDNSILTTIASVQPITRGVELEPPADAKSGDAGDDVVYHLTVTNTGSVTDTITLGAGGYAWTTAVSPTIVSLPSLGSSPVVVTATIPNTATNGQFDVATITAQATGVSDSSLLTTTAVVTPPVYGVELTPDTAAKTDNPGETVTYTLFVENTGDTADSYDLSLGLHVWTTTLSANSVGPLDPGATDDFEVYVTIPGGASNGENDAVGVTATSQGDASVHDTSALTTTATTQVITRGVEIAPPTAAGAGPAGSVVRYTLTVTNTGSVTDTITLSSSGHAWTIQISPAGVPLPSMGHATVVVSVTVPLAATVGMSDTATILAEATGVSDSSLLTTTVSARLYLPVVMRNH